MSASRPYAIAISLAQWLGGTQHPILHDPAAAILFPAEMGRSSQAALPSKETVGSAQRSAGVT
jgi:hypothetical protein